VVRIAEIFGGADLALATRDYGVCIMKRSFAWTVASLLAATFGATGSALAAEKGVLTGSPTAVLDALAGNVVPAAELGKEHGRGITINTGAGAAASAGTSSGNAVIGSPLTGFISNDHSIDNNAGITSVLQNFGNNSVVQASTTINITVSK
jgi:hypothetical protein